jgi:hypothetical protein
MMANKRKQQKKKPCSRVKHPGGHGKENDLQAS